MQQWHVYEDWTLEKHPRCFYVGKGDDDRVAKLKRSNSQHSNVASQFGLRRLIVLSGRCEKEILDEERHVIIERHTYVNDPEYNGIGCNRTRGGQGNSGRVVSEETCKKISDAKRGKKPNKVWIQTERNATSARMSLLHKGKTLSEEHLEALRARMADPEIKQEMIDKVTASINAKYENDPEFYQHIVETRARGERSSSPFTENDVKQMRDEWEFVDQTVKGNRWSMSPARKFCKRWAETKGVSNQAVHAIVTRKTWRHLP